MITVTTVRNEASAKIATEPATGERGHSGGEIGGQLKALSVGLNDLAILLSRLEERLAPVMRAEPKSAPTCAGTANDPVATAPLAMELRGRAEWACETARRVESMLNRLEC